MLLSDELEGFRSWVECGEMLDGLARGSWLAVLLSTTATSLVCVDVLPACLFVLCIHSVSVEARRGLQTPWVYSYRQLCGVMRVKPGCVEKQSELFSLSYLSIPK